MFNLLTPADLAAMSDDKRKHVEAAVALTERLNTFLNAQGESMPVTLDAVFNLYVTACIHYGQQRQVAGFLVALGSSWLLEGTAADQTPTSGTVH